MSETKQVKVDNWGIYFLQRLKHFFNRTDYCDLTLQFQDNAQLKVHRLVLSACTEYFELLERTCEMYEDCLVMPDDLQADVVVPIVNFMYTGQLEFRMDIIDKLYQTSEIMNMPVLTKLLDSHRPKNKPQPAVQSYSAVKRLPKHMDTLKETVKSITPMEIVTTATVTNKRRYPKSFEKTTVYRDKKFYLPVNKPTLVSNGSRTYREPSPIPLDSRFNKKVILGDPRPTRYELPEELDSDNIFENSFCNISYTSQPLMVHPETRKQYSKRPRMISEASSSKKMHASTVDIVDCKKVSKGHDDILFEDTIPVTDESDMFSQSYGSVKAVSIKDSNQLFDQILEHNNESSKVTIETKNAKASANLDHAKIISEVLKKYPHLVKSNKNIKLKILNTPSKNAKKQKVSPVKATEKPALKTEKETDFTFETDVLDSKQAAQLIALGAENIEGPWICLICGTPGKAMNFTSYYKFRRHLVEVHHEKPVLNICEYCGQKSTKRNYLHHHLYTKHGVEPPPLYHFPKCNYCNYIALSEALLLKHKASHTENKNFRCNVCPAAFNSSNHLLMHIQNTGHKYSAERKSNLQCIYCQKVFMREVNLCAHLKTHHKGKAMRDGIIDDSDEESSETKVKNISVKTEPTVNDYEELDIQYQIQQRPDGNIHVVTKKAPEPVTNTKQKILNAGFTAPILTHKNKTSKTTNSQNEYIQEINMSNANDSSEEIIMIDNIEYSLRDNQLIPRRSKQLTEEFVLPDDGLQAGTQHTTSMEFTNMHNNDIQEENIQQTNVVLKNPGNLNQPIPIYVSNEEEYKALMGSNQPIIFDGGDSNKTLTVLTAPHASTLETTSIDLDNTQSNDMMIIQDDFPLNVSEAVATDNSNIVVVYSHQVGDQNKQYQLLTTQGLGAQFVQSSAILTQNYETVTTTTPIMNAHVLDKQVEEAWQNNLQQIINTEQIEITPVTTLESIVNANQVQITNTTVPNCDLNELSDVQMVSNVTDSNNMNVTNIATNQQLNVAEEDPVAENLIENVEEQIANNTHDISSMEVDEEMPIVHPVEQTDDSIKNVDAPSEDEPLSTEAVIQENENIMQHAESMELEQEPIIQTTTDNVNEVLQQADDMNISNQATELENIELEHNINEQVLEPNNTSDLPTNIEPELVPDDVTEKVQTLASEWSEEDLDTNQIETAAQDSTMNEGQTKSATIAETCEEIEESIENIQQEVDKQLQERSVIESGVEINNDASSQEETEKEENIPETVSTVPPVIQEKITSLLNDWEDNDSQEDNNSVNENLPVEPDETIDGASAHINEVTTANLDVDKQANIKSLVSDWDEDDEESKE